VTLVTPSAFVSAWTINTLEQASIHARLVELGVTIVLNRAVSRIEGGQVVSECVFSGREESSAADAVVMVASRVGNDSLWQELSARQDEWQVNGIKSIKLIGDDDDDDLNKWSGFKGGKRSNKTHRSVVDPEARLMRKGGGSAHLSHSMHVMTDSESGLCVSIAVDVADGRAERRNALAMLDRVQRRHDILPRVIAADAGYGTGDFLCGVEDRGITPHAAMTSHPIIGDTERHAARRRMRRRHRTKSYRTSQRIRRLVEPVIGWCKDTGKLARTRFLGRPRIQDDARLVGAAWNLLRMTSLSGAT